MDLTTLFVEAVIGYMKYMDLPQFSCVEFETLRCLSQSHVTEGIHTNGLFCKKINHDVQLVFEGRHNLLTFLLHSVALKMKYPA